MQSDLFEASHWPEVAGSPSCPPCAWIRDLDTLILAIQTAWTPGCASVANLPAEAYFRAVRHCFDAYRSGIVVSIRAGKIVLFLPFVNDMYTNRLFPPRSFPDYARLKQAGQGARTAEDIIPDASRWWFNGHMVCNVRYPPSDYQVHELKQMIHCAAAGLCALNADFVINKRDCPLWFKGGKSCTLPVLPFHLPVLSPYTSRRVHDLPMVLGDDWKLATLGRPIAPTPWKERPDSRAVFRGSSTGKGLTPETNARMALYKFACSYPAQFDVRLTRINNRDQIVHAPLSASITCDFPRVKALALELDANPRHYLSLEQQSKTYKLAIYIRGHQAASRLGALLAHGFCVIYYRPPDEDLDAPGCDPWMLSMLQDATTWKVAQQDAPGAPGAQSAQSAPGDRAVAPAPALPSADSASHKLLTLLGPGRKRSRHQGTSRPAAAPSLGQWLGSGSVPSVPSHEQPVCEESGHVCFVSSFEEMVECIVYMQRHDAVAERIASNARRLSSEKIHNRDFLVHYIRSLLLKCECPVGDETHPLFGAINFEFITKARNG